MKNVAQETEKAIAGAIKINTTEVMVSIQIKIFRIKWLN